jgi:hypothetical protein
MKRRIAIEAGDSNLKFFDCIIPTLIPHNMLFVLSKRLVGVVVRFLLQSLGFHQGIKLVRQHFNLMCSTIHTLGLVGSFLATSPSTI